MNGGKWSQWECIYTIMEKYGYCVNETVRRRIFRYDFQENTVITYGATCIKISTETAIQGVHNVLLLFADGTSKLDFAFD